MYIKRLFIVLIAVQCSIGCSLFSGSGGDTEMVFAATEVGTPEGDKVAKDIGPEGGTLTSPDGRMTLTVPQGALIETIPFSMQPITNKAGNGLGLAYRLEPSGKTFTTPLHVSVRYDEKDLEGTVPEAFSLAYQDQKGAWHELKSEKLDHIGKTLTVTTTHFTDVALLARLRLSPAEAKLRTRESKWIQLLECKEPGVLDKILSRPLDCSKSPLGRTSWKLRGPGTLASQGSNDTGVLYTAPAQKPADNIAFVDLTIDFYFRVPETGATFVVQKTFTANITIIDRGYRATGKTADAVYSGVICGLEDPFEVTVTTPLFTYPFKFVPNSGRGTTGTMSFAAKVSVISMQGTGTYTIEGSDTDKPRIALTADTVGHTPIGSKSGGGTVYIDLVPLETDECNEK